MKPLSLFAVFLFYAYNSISQDSTLYVILEEEMYGYINKTGKIVLSPQFHFAGDFYNGVAVARKDGAYGYINRKGEFVIPPVYDFAHDFRDNIAKVNDGKEEYYINLRGKRENLQAEHCLDSYSYCSYKPFIYGSRC